MVQFVENVFENGTVHPVSSIIAAAQATERTISNDDLVHEAQTSTREEAIESILEESYSVCSWCARWYALKVCL
jgi:hypothetical protein